ncbi:hypothetical protein C6497_04755 [Candidatus Poribacteria bacterium]|nr:MAG: hypothetical protein C6497_04755 [Candidatus Poribacteria bacterium]
MRKKLYWGLGILIIMIGLISAFVFLPRELSLIDYYAQVPFEKNKLREQFIQDQPYSEAALAARIFLARYDTSDSEELEALKVALKYHPNSPALLVKLAYKTCMDFPDESVAYATKALRLLPNSSENSLLYQTSGGGIYTPLEDAHDSLGIAYQYLGDYESALFHLKEAQRLFKPTNDAFGDKLRSRSYVSNIAGIESGNPRHKPRERQSNNK